MSKTNDDFFEQKKPWSLIKDELLCFYLKPYFTKILHSRCPIVYVDCFAGKGKFADGTEGSPLLALNILQECIEHSKSNNTIDLYFIDPTYFNDLEKNVNEFCNDKAIHNSNIRRQAQAIKGHYEDVILNLLSKYRSCNVFLYIDPYGIKSLNYDIFHKLSINDFNSIELLINFNSMGFIRYACQTLKVSDKDIPVYDIKDDIDLDSDSNNISIDTLNKIANGDYWKNIIYDKQNGKINIYTAESLIAEQYCRNIKKDFRYVFNIPIQIKNGNLPKYRMIYATNSVDGCLLMVDNIYKRWQKMQDIQDNGNQRLWTEDIKNDLITPDKIYNNFISVLKDYRKSTPLDYIIADFYARFDVICEPMALHNICKNLEEQNKIHVFRKPSRRKNGKPTTFFTTNGGKEIEIEWIE